MDRLDASLPIPISELSICSYLEVRRIPLGLLYFALEVLEFPSAKALARLGASRRRNASWSACRVGQRGSGFEGSYASRGGYGFALPNYITECYRSGRECLSAAQSVLALMVRRRLLVVQSRSSTEIPCSSLSAVECRAEYRMPPMEYDRALAVGA